MHAYQYFLFLLSLGLKERECYWRWICHLRVPHLWIPIPKSDMVQGRLPDRKLHWFPDNLPEWNCSSYDSWSLCRRQWAIYLQCCERGWDRQHILLSSCARSVATPPPTFHACHHCRLTLLFTVRCLHTSQWSALLELRGWLWGQLNCDAKQRSLMKQTKHLT